MHGWVFNFAFAAHVIFIAALAVHAVRTRQITSRALALEVLALVFVSAFVLLALDRGEAGYLDAALVVALLGYAQVVATAQLISEWRGPR